MQELDDGALTDPPSFFPITIMLRMFLAALLLGCAATTSAATLRIGLSSDITSLDPQFLATQPNLTAARHMFESLVDVDERTHLIPGLATSWRALDPLTWEFRLRQGVKFHDGSALTVGDVIFSLQRPLSIQGSPGGFAAYVRSIASLQAVDDYTLRVVTRTPYGALPEDINSILIISKRAAEHATPADFDAGRALVGTGPYRFARYARGDRLELVRHDEYWGKRPLWERVELRTMTTDPIRTAALLSGEVDVIEHVPSADYARLAARPELHLEQTVSWRTIFLTLDQYRDRPPGIAGKSGQTARANPFRDRRVRLALSKAIDRDALARIVLEGLAMPAANIVSPGVFGHDPALRPEPVDRDAARHLLAEAGYPNGFELTLSGPNNRYINDEQVLQAVAQMLAHVGIRAYVEAAPLNVFLTRVRREQTSFALLGWGSFAADLAMRSLIAAPDRERGYGAWNWGRYSSPALNR
ncbi:MAG TPA: ABC transporter substrate-binding protein, partial [Burkholderiales bacterium]|nr:ABC transporter substrate-binding protein [Burkholderiales bacterium]